MHFFTKPVRTAYDYASLEAATRSLQTGDAALTLTELDIEQCQVDPAPSSRLLLRLTKAASTQHAAFLRATKDTQPFFVTLDDKKLYVGVVYTMYGAAAIKTPVLHIDDQNGRVELKLGTHVGAWVGWGKKGTGPPIDPAAARQLFKGLGKLSAL